MPMTKPLNAIKAAWGRFARSGAMAEAKGIAADMAIHSGMAGMNAAGKLRPTLKFGAMANIGVGAAAGAASGGIYSAASDDGKMSRDVTRGALLGALGGFGVNAGRGVWATKGRIGKAGTAAWGSGEASVSSFAKRWGNEAKGMARDLRSGQKRMNFSAKMPAGAEVNPAQGSLF